MLKNKKKGVCAPFFFIFADIMKNISTILSIVAIALAGGIYFFQAHEIKELKKQEAADKNVGPVNTFKIAYFDMDSLQAHYEYYKFVIGKLRDQENNVNMQLSSLDRENQKKMDYWRAKGNNMTQAEAEQAQAQYQNLQQEFAQQKQTLEQGLYKNQEEYRTKLRSRIEEFLKSYNKDKHYSYIFQYDHSGSIILTKDSLLNISNDVIDGLNAEYKKNPQ